MALKKNSGILRYRFGDGGQFPALVAGHAPTVVKVLDVDAETPDVDQDGQNFGASPGHAAIASPPAITPSALRAADPVAENVPLPVTPPAQAGRRDIGRIPSGTKVWAYFIPQVTSNAARPVQVNVLTFVAESVVYQDQGAGVVASGATPYISVIQVELFAVGTGDDAVAGTLVVELEHSMLDLPGLVSQNQNNLLPPD